VAKERLGRNLLQWTTIFLSDRHNLLFSSKPRV
jgi:hypothetical protein